VAGACIWRKARAIAAQQALRSRHGSEKTGICRYAGGAALIRNLRRPVAQP
jgi:hypothetical protein